MPGDTDAFVSLVVIGSIVVGSVAILLPVIGIIIFVRMHKRVSPNGDGRVIGTAQVVSVSQNPDRSFFEGCILDLVVRAPTVLRTAIRHFEMVDTELWPSIGQVLPASIDPVNPQQISILWDQVQSNTEKSAAEAQRIAQAMRTDLAGQNYGTPQRQPASTPGSVPVDVAGALQRLAMLHASGTISDSEFNTEQARISGGER